jgi:hypothetical protein
MARDGYCQVSGEWCQSLDEHHVIPREYGGVDGPTIFLSPSIHQTIHRVAFNDTKVSEFISRYPNSQKTIYYLVEMIRFCKENATKVQQDNLTISLKSFTISEQMLLFANAKKHNVPISKMLVLIVKQVLKSLAPET